MTDQRQEIVEALTAASRIVVVSHMNPDPDAYGSTLGLAAVLEAKGKTIASVNVDGASDRYECIPGMESIVDTVPEGEWELVVAVDAATLGRLGDGFCDSIFAVAPRSINIDHHISNTSYGDLNYVDAKASSTCEILALLVEEAGWEMPEKAARAFLAGIYGDTGAFRYASTTTKTFAVAQQLIAAGAIAHETAADIYGRKRLSAVRLQATALLNLELHVDGKLAIGLLDQEVFDSCGATHEDAEGLVEEMRDIDGVEVAALGYWFGDCWKVSMRSVRNSLNVSEVAVGFGGGGHVQAAAFRSRGEREQVYSSLLERLKALLTE